MGFRCLLKSSRAAMATTTNATATETAATGTVGEATETLGGIVPYPKGVYCSLVAYFLREGGSALKGI